MYYSMHGSQIGANRLASGGGLKLVGGGLNSWERLE